MFNSLRPQKHFEGVKFFANLQERVEILIFEFKKHIFGPFWQKRKALKNYEKIIIDTKCYILKSHEVSRKSVARGGNEKWANIKIIIGNYSFPEEGRKLKFSGSEFLHNKNNAMVRF